MPSISKWVISKWNLFLDTWHSFLGLGMKKTTKKREKEGGKKGERKEKRKKKTGFQVLALLLYA